CSLLLLQAQHVGSDDRRRLCPYVCLCLRDTLVGLVLLPALQARECIIEPCVPLLLELLPWCQRFRCHRANKARISRPWCLDLRYYRTNKARLPRPWCLATERLRGHVVRKGLRCCTSDSIACCPRIGCVRLGIRPARDQGLDRVERRQMPAEERDLRHEAR